MTAVQWPFVLRWNSGVYQSSLRSANEKTCSPPLFICLFHMYDYLAVFSVFLEKAVCFFIKWTYRQNVIWLEGGLCSGTSSQAKGLVQEDCKSRFTFFTPKHKWNLPKATQFVHALWVLCAIRRPLAFKDTVWTILLHCIDSPSIWASARFDKLGWLAPYQKTISSYNPPLNFRAR